MGNLSRLTLAGLLIATGAASRAYAQSAATQPTPVQASPSGSASPDDKRPDSPVAGNTDPDLQRINDATFAPVSVQKAPNPVIIKAEVLLDRADASPGVIDGLLGDNFKKSLAIFEARRGLPVNGALTQDVWNALTQDKAPVLAPYTVTPADVAGPFTPDIPTDYAKMAKLPQLGYRNEAEMFGERFHMDQALLTALNPGVDMTKAGSKIIVAQVTRVQLPGKISDIDVDKSKGQVRAYDADGKLLVAYPASVGSEELPSPSGTHRVKGVARHPVYSYNPQKKLSARSQH